MEASIKTEGYISDTDLLCFFPVIFKRASFVDIAVYPDQDAADSNKEARQKFHDDVFGSSLKDEFYYEGDIDYFYQSETFKKLAL